MNDERVMQALRALAESDRAKEAAPALAGCLLDGYRRKRRERIWKRAAVWSLAAAAVVAALLVFNNRPLPKRESAAVSVPPAPAAAVQVPIAMEARPKLVRSARPEPTHEVVTDFYPLMDIAPPFERGQLIRVNMQAAALRTVGLPVSDDHLADPILADVLVGEEGLARAIRFVKTSR